MSACGLPIAERNQSQKAMPMEKQAIVQDLLTQMRTTLENRERYPQSFVDSRVVNLSNYLATFTGEQSMPFDWRAFADTRKEASY